MGFLEMSSPTSFRTRAAEMGASFDALGSGVASPFVVFSKPHDSHPAVGYLVLLVFEAVMEVVCVSLPGYIIARMGQFDAEKQKFLANLNVMLFTPCLIFTKLASQLNGESLSDLAVIPVIFAIHTLVSYLISKAVAKCFGFNRRASNFVTAMGVFGNSNSLPISLVISLSQTLKGLHWDRIPGDDDDEVAARGILYLLIFQQLGQLVRWSWGYHVLLAPKDKYDEYNDLLVEEGRYRDRQSGEEEDGLIQGLDSIREMGDERRPDGPRESGEAASSQEGTEGYDPAGQTPVAGSSSTSPTHSDAEENGLARKKCVSAYLNGNGSNPILFPSIRAVEEAEAPPGMKGMVARAGKFLERQWACLRHVFVNTGRRAWFSLPSPVQTLLSGAGVIGGRVYAFLWEFMNPPLWAMLMAVLVASIPRLQRLFFEEGSFVKNSVTNAVRSSGGVAVPLILVVLGANLARNTQKREEEADPEERQIGTRLLVASLLSRMLLPFLVMAPLLALFAKYVPVSILDDPIFIIVCFLLVGAPSALQLAQICQINCVYENVMSKVLFQSYVIWILPSTLMLVMTALEVVEWAA